MPEYGMTVEMEPIDRLCEDFDHLGDELMRKLQGQTGYDIRFLLSSSAKDLAPVRRSGMGGTLRQMIDSAGIGFAKPNGDDEVDIGIVSCAYYSLFVEYGTGYKGDPLPNGGTHTSKKSWIYYDEDGIRHIGKPQPPQSFMRKALKSNVPNIKRILSGAVEEVFQQ